MGTVCYAPDIPLLDRPINPYSGLEFPGKQMRPRDMVEDYKSPQVLTTPMNPYHLNHIRVSNSGQAATTPQNVTFAPVSPPQLNPRQPNALLQQLQSSPQAAVHGPPPELATPCDLPPVTEAIMQRRKRLKMFRFEGISKGVQLGPYRYHADGIIYFGQWQNGTPHGKGIIYFPDGSVFEGGFIDGKSAGKGRLISRNGDYYEGDVSANVATGVGISENNMIRYEGQFQNNLPHGQGVQTSLDGRSRFVGSFYQGSKVSGQLTWGDHGEYVYEGRFANNTFNGRGVLRSPAGVYFGEFVNGHKQGLGQMYSAAGALVYKGNWVNDVPEGSPQLYSPQVVHAPQ